MKTIADKNRVETELRFTPSNIEGGKSGGKGKRIAQWVILTIICIVAGWFVFGIAKEVMTVVDVKLSHLLIAFLVLRWLFVKGASTLKTLILIIIITAIFN